MPVRIYDISKKLGLETKDVLAKAKALGIACAKVPSSSLDKISAEWLEQELLKLKPNAAQGQTAIVPPNSEIPQKVTSWDERLARAAQTATPAWRERLNRVRAMAAQRNEAEVEHKALIQRARDILTAKKTQNTIEEQFRSKLKTEFLILDSNIWMKPECESLFQVLQLLKIKCIIVGDQWDEICNKKQRTNYGTEENSRARLAINRVEKFDELELLEIDGCSFAPNKAALADPEILKYAVGIIEKGGPVVIVTDDQELRVRARQILKTKARDKFKVLKSSDLLEDAEKIVKEYKAE